MFSKDVAATSWMEEPVWQCLFEALDLIVLQTTKAKAAWLKAKAAMINTAAGDEAPVSSDVTPCVECHSLCGMSLLVWNVIECNANRSCGVLQACGENVFRALHRPSSTSSLGYAHIVALTFSCSRMRERTRAHTIHTCIHTHHVPIYQ